MITVSLLLVAGLLLAILVTLDRLQRVVRTLADDFADRYQTDAEYRRLSLEQFERVFGYD